MLEEDNEEKLDELDEDEVDELEELAEQPGRGPVKLAPLTFSPPLKVALA